jgi:hypothetical protein
MSKDPVDLGIQPPKPNVVTTFSPWFEWGARTTMPDGYGGYLHEYGGVYLLAHFAKRPSLGAANILDDSIVYVGEGSLLVRRWNQFERSALLGSNGHSGGHSHRQWRDATGVSWKTLYVSAFPVWFDPSDSVDPAVLETRYRRYVEQLVLWRLTCHRHDRGLPLLNRK